VAIKKPPDGGGVVSRRTFTAADALLLEGIRSVILPCLCIVRHLFQQAKGFLTLGLGTLPGAWRLGVKVPGITGCSLQQVFCGSDRLPDGLIFGFQVGGAGAV